jgi:ubiquitin-conjugating enzyme E2 A
MASSARRRLLKDMQAIRNDKDEGYAAVPFQDNLLMWSAVIYGPEDTIW